MGGGRLHDDVISSITVGDQLSKRCFWFTREETFCSTIFTCWVHRLSRKINDLKQPVCFVKIAFWLPHSVELKIILWEY